MTTINQEMFDALMSAGANEEKAKKAAEQDVSIHVLSEKITMLQWIFGVGFTVLFLMNLLVLLSLINK